MVTTKPVTASSTPFGERFALLVSVIGKSASLGVGRTVVEGGMECTCGAVEVSTRVLAPLPLGPLEPLEVAGGRWEVCRVRPVSVALPFTGLSGTRAAPARHIPSVRHGMIHSRPRGPVSSGKFDSRDSHCFSPTAVQTVGRVKAPLSCALQRFPVYPALPSRVNGPHSLSQSHQRRSCS